MHHFLNTHRLTIYLLPTTQPIISLTLSLIHSLYPLVPSLDHSVMCSAHIYQVLPCPRCCARCWVAVKTKTKVSPSRSSVQQGNKHRVNKHITRQSNTCNNRSTKYRDSRVGINFICEEFRQLHLNWFGKLGIVLPSLQEDISFQTRTACVKTGMHKITVLWNERRSDIGRTQRNHNFSSENVDIKLPNFFEI